MTLTKNNNGTASDDISGTYLARGSHDHKIQLVSNTDGKIQIKYAKDAGGTVDTYSTGVMLNGYAYNLRVDGDTLKWSDGSGDEKSFKKADAPTAAAASATYTYLVDRSGSNVGFDVRVGDENDQELFIK
jgi:hypothetical protein